MPEFLELLPPKAAMKRFLAAIPEREGQFHESVPTSEALGRVLGAEIRAEHPLPPFPRSTVDGYAVRAQDTYGASGSLPAYLSLVGEVPMGAPAELEVDQGEAVIVHTGGMIPAGADAVVMLEDTQRVDEREIEVLKPVSVGQSVLARGEDVKSGDIVVPAGRKLRAQEIGGLMALGVTNVRVAVRPRVAILSTGDEVVPPSTEPRFGQIRDVNSYTLQAIVSRAGGEPILHGIISDQFEDLLRAVERAHDRDDLVIVTAGSSVSTRDLTARVFQQMGEPGVLVHGISIKPGKPTILAVGGNIPLIGLPGNPVSALVVARIVVLPVIRLLLGDEQPEIESTVSARMTINVASETGREDYLPVSLVQRGGVLRADPVFGRSNLIFTLVRADGVVRIPPEATGLAAEEEVQVQLFPE